jgi:hypothetical protein
MTIDDWYGEEGNYAGRELSVWKQLLSMASVYHLALLSTNNYLLAVVSDGLCHYSACHSPDFIMRKNESTSYKNSRFKFLEVS